MNKILKPLVLVMAFCFALVCNAQAAPTQHSAIDKQQIANHLTLPAATVREVMPAGEAIVGLAEQTADSEQQTATAQAVAVTTPAVTPLSKQAALPAAVPEAKAAPGRRTPNRKQPETILKL